jgi:RNA polymerase sigma-70 factor, ECF subfamily
VDTYGQRLARLRAARGLSQRELAEAAEVTAGYLSRIERGDRPPPSLTVARSLARHLGVSENDLDPETESEDLVTALAAQVERREADALVRSLHARFAPQLYTFCLQRLGSHEEAEDATQLTFLNAFRGLERGDSPEYESAWLFKIAHNVCLNSRRSSFRRRSIETPSDPEKLSGQTHSRAYEPDELRGLIDALRALPEKQRQVILLREWRGLSYEEIAAALDLSHAAVETLLFRARLLFRGRRSRSSRTTDDDRL